MPLLVFSDASNGDVRIDEKFQVIIRLPVIYVTSDVFFVRLDTHCGFWRGILGLNIHSVSAPLPQKASICWLYRHIEAESPISLQLHLVEL